ncbi:unnamed protein product, partial [Iphiclides podalirius]
MKIGDWGLEHNGLRRRRYSLSGDMDTLNRDNVYKLQNLEVENTMLKNEINVMNKEISDLLDRLRKTEDDYSQFKSERNNTDLQSHKLKLDNESLTLQLDHLRRKLVDLNSMDVKNREQSQELEAETSLLRNNVRKLEDRLNEVNEDIKNKDILISKLENELRHTQAVICEQQSSIEKSTSECLRLEKDWESYKMRVKGMLYAKDEELKKIREGANLTEDAKELMEEIESLKQERAELAEEMAEVRQESENTKEKLQEIKTRHSAVEKIVLALRDALKEERSARTKAEVECAALGKELKALQLESGQTIAKLRSSLQSREEELAIVREASRGSTTDTSALNVADYEVAQVAMDKERMEHLTQMLVQKQGRIEALLADNNTLRIQLDKLQSKYKAEVAAHKAGNAHSIVQLQDGDVRPRTRANNYSPANTLTRMSLRMGLLGKRYPVFRLFVVLYMIGLHLWVFTVLLSSTPEDYVRPSKT